MTSGSFKSSGGVVATGGGGRMPWAKALPWPPAIITVIAPAINTGRYRRHMAAFPTACRLRRGGGEANRLGPPPRRHLIGADLLQGEHEDGAPSREVSDLGPECRIQSQDEGPESARDRDVLLAIHGVADGAAPVAGACPEVPQLFSSVPVVGVHHTLDVTVEDETPTRG